MPGEKYIIAAADNNTQISVRNMINPAGFVYLAHCGDAATLLRLIHGMNPDFVIVDTAVGSSGLINAIETIDDEMPCACIVISDNKAAGIANLLSNARSVSFCKKPLARELLINTIELSLMYFIRMKTIDRKLKEMTENYETRKQVERAKWILMEDECLTEEDAYDKLRKRSMDIRMPMKAIAEDVIIAHEMHRKK